MVGKRRRPQVPQPEAVIDQVVTEASSPAIADLEGSESPYPSQISATFETSTDQDRNRNFCFKDPVFEATRGGRVSKRSRTWKTLKQIIAADRILPSGKSDETTATYGSIDAPTSFRPSRKYSDISGLQASYTDPQTKLRYSTAEEYSRLRMLPMDIVNGLLLLRRANNPSAT